MRNLVRVATCILLLLGALLLGPQFLSESHFAAQAQESDTEADTTEADGAVEAEATEEAVAVTTGKHQVRLETQGGTMVQVRADGRVLFNGFLRKGVERKWTGDTLALRISNADEVFIAFDQQSLRPAGLNNEMVTINWPPGEDFREAAYYEVQAGDTLGAISLELDVSLDTLYAANNLSDADFLRAGTYLIIPGTDGSLPSTALLPPALVESTETGAGASGTATLPPAAVVPVPRGSIVERMTTTARNAEPGSPFYNTTWVTYYGRPGVPVMGILGEYDIDGLVPLLRRQAEAYDVANGEELSVTPSFHLVYGMASKGEGLDGSYLIFEQDELVQAYIDRAEEEDFTVILDIQIGALSPADALEYGFRWLEHEHVHLALDPEFAMAHEGQAWPGDPIGFVTAAQINAAQAAMNQYMEENGIEGQRVLLVHQFLYDMIRNKDELKWDYEHVALTISADGWGGPWGKITKYNSFMDPENGYSAFKLFYRWDEPLMTEGETLGEDPYADVGWMDVTPNLIMYQ